MGLITKEVKTNWSNITKKHYTDKGYIFTKTGDSLIVNVCDLMKRSRIRVDVCCDICGNMVNHTYDNYNKLSIDGKYYCKKCAIKIYSLKNMKMSFQDWCETNLSVSECNKVLQRWDYEKNQCSPKDVSYSSNLNGGYWFKCEHHESEKKHISSFVRGQKRSICCDKCQKIYHTNPELIPYFVNLEDTKRYPVRSNKEVDMKCPICGHKRKMRINNMTSFGFSCPVCGDSISMPNKIMRSVLSQIGIKFETEKHFNWCHFLFKGIIKKGIYDFYFELDKNKYIIEMDGGFHFMDNPKNGQTKEDSKFIDTQKDELATKHHIQVKRINCQKSTFENIRESIINSELSKILDLSCVDWNICNKYSINSLLIKSCEMWNQNYIVRQIGENLNLHINTIINYLHRGTKIGLCEYRPEDTMAKYKQNIICVNTSQIFKNKEEASKITGADIGTILKCLKGKSKSAGNTPIGEKLHWMYLSQYEDMDEEMLNKYMISVQVSKNPHKRKIICTNYNTVFNCVYDAANMYGIWENTILRNAKGGCKSGGHLPDGTKLHWRYYDEWLKEFPQEESQIVI